MKRLPIALSLLLGAAFALTLASPAAALPPPCDCAYCLDDPSQHCALFGVGIPCTRFIDMAGCFTPSSARTAEPSFFAGPAPAAPAPQPLPMGGCAGFGARVQVTPSGYGSGVDQDLSNPSCSGGPRYSAGDTVRFIANTFAGHSFDHWSNGANCPCSGSNPICDFTMPSALVVCIANFV